MTILGLYNIYYGIFRGQIKGGERWMGDEQEREKRERGIKGQVHAGRLLVSTFWPALHLITRVCPTFLLSSFFCYFFCASVFSIVGKRIH